MITRRQMEETEARYVARSEQREDVRRKVAARRLTLAPTAGALAEPICRGSGRPEDVADVGHAYASDSVVPGVPESSPTVREPGLPPP